jgi:hypothetical protein
MIKKGVLTESEKEEFFKALGRSEIIEKEASISWDGANLLLRLPREIADYLDINEKNRLTKKIIFRIEEANGEMKKEFDVKER